MNKNYDDDNRGNHSDNRGKSGRQTTSHNDVAALTILLLKERKIFDGLTRQEMLHRLERAGFNPSYKLLKLTCEQCGITIRVQRRRSAARKQGATSKNIRIVAGIVKALAQHGELEKTDFDMLTAICGGKPLGESADDYDGANGDDDDDGMGGVPC